jgi:hypothetical protein
VVSRVIVIHAAAQKPKTSNGNTRCRPAQTQTRQRTQVFRKFPDLSSHPDCASTRAIGDHEPFSNSINIMRIRLFFVLGLMACATGAAAQTGGYVAGLQPDRRPDTAPRLTEAARTPGQMKYALHGIEKPVPGNVESIAATGNWWVPLRQPGMAGAYDLRNWHAASASTAASSAGNLSTAGSLAR